ncbi:DinB family protein [Flagellimonas flava]|uniref:DinB superfamily protein n=1 Tax=Flagellimonas flava TaxID=570519 RepID=A0A1M5KLP0_9FLAO|nr:DinB family protein [Allomuricauda flava]SHG53399.1 DinB superfamily protein [Allomuricauda flava]
MRKLILPLVALLLFSFGNDTYKLSDEDRKMAVKHLNESKEQMAKVLKGLTAEQLNFQPGEDVWSIAQCVEHLAISENAFGGLIQKTVAAGPNPALKDSVKLNDEQLLGIIKDRSQRVKTREPFEPSGKFGSHEATVEAFMNKRKEHISYLESTEDDLRNLYSSDLPFGTIDGVQLILFMSGHTDRHVSQMKEVMAHKLFPDNVD